MAPGRPYPGGVPEWLNGAVSKTVVGRLVHRGFESHPLRCSRQAWTWFEAKKHAGASPAAALERFGSSRLLLFDPSTREYYSLEGLAHILRTVALVRERLNPALEVEGIVLTMFDGRTSLATQVKSEVQGHLGGQVLRTLIPRNVRISEAPSHGRPIMFYDLRSPGSVAYLELAKEVLAHES